MAACEDPNMETPPGGNSRKRRSWFTPGKAPVAFQLAVQPPSPEAPMIDTTDLETLTLTHFTRPPKVDFGTARPGDCVTRHLRVVNPHEYPQEVRVDRAGRDFTLSDSALTVEGESEVILSVEWIPLTVGAYRETVLFKVDGAYKLQATFMGKLEEPPKPKKKVRKTWANKPFVPVRGVLRTSNKHNTSTQQQPVAPRPKLTKSRSPTAKSRSPPAKPAAKRGTRPTTNKLKTPPPKRISDPAPKAVNTTAADPVTYFNPQVPLNPASFIFEKRTMPPGPLDSPVEPRRTTFEKSSPEMPNTPVISEKTPPKSMREKALQPRRIIKEKSPSPLGAVRESVREYTEDLENLPPMPYCEEGTPGISTPRTSNRRRKSKMRRSNTYTKLNDSTIQSPPDSAETTVIEQTEMIECVEVTESVEVTECVELTEYTEEYQEEVEYLVEEDGAGGETRTEVSRATRPLGRHVFSQQAESNTTYHTHHTNTTTAFDATRVLSRYSDVNSSRMSMPAPHHATFVTSPLAAPPNLLSETRVLTPRGSNVYTNARLSALPNLSETRVLTPRGSNMNNSTMLGPQSNLSETRVLTPRGSHVNNSTLLGAPSNLSETRVLTPQRVSSISNHAMRESLPISQHDERSHARVHTPTPASPRRFFSDLLALHNSSKEDSETSREDSQTSQDDSQTRREDLQISQEDSQMRREDSQSSQENSQTSREDSQTCRENSQTSLEDSQMFDKTPPQTVFPESLPSPDPRRVSTLTVTKDQPVVSREEFVPCKALFEAEEAPVVVDPRRFSTLTITKTRPSEHLVPIVQEQDPRRVSTLTVTKNRPSERLVPIVQEQDPRRGSSLTVTKTPSVPSPQGVGIEGRCLFEVTSPTCRTPDSPGVTPLTHSPSTPRGRQPTLTPDSLGVTPLSHSPSPGRHTPTKINIQGVNYPGSRSLRHMDEDRSVSQSISPRKKTPRERTRRRTSGQFRRRSNTYQANSSLNGSLVARGLVPSDQDSEATVRDSPQTDDQFGDSPLTMSELGTSADYTAPPLVPSPLHAAPPNNQPSIIKPIKSGIVGTLRESNREPRAATKPPVPRAAIAAKRPPVVANYLRPTSAAQNRRQAVADGKKRELSSDRRPGTGGKTTGGRQVQEPAPKKVRREGSAAPQSVVGGLTKTQALRREAALAGMSKENKKPAAPRPKPKPKVAQRSLRLMAGSNKTALPKHPMAFASKNKYYDERWKEKQERGFVRWLNFVLTPPEEESSAADKKQKVDAGALSVTAQSGPQPAPSKETLSYRVYSARRRLNRLRRGACKLFTSDAFTRFEQKLEIEAECGRIMVRSDRMIHADVGIKQCILDLLLSYNPLWLRIGLETVYGEMLPITSNSDVVGMSRFILTRLLSNPYIAEEYAHPTVPHLYRDGYNKRIAQFSLKQFLLLVTFLDLAKTSRLIDHDPCLFCRNSEYKASREVLLVFSRDYLSGEGDLGKHLTYMGYTVKHVQTPLDELDYAVSNLAVDLRDGTRLTRVMAMLTERWTLTNELRVPAISRLQKVHNIGVAFKTLSNMGLDLSTIKGGKIDARDICDGHREKTLHLLWQIIFKFQIELLLSEDQLRDEIRFLRANLSIQTCLDAALNDDIDALGIPEARRESVDTDLYFKSPRLSLLLTWCRAVCAYYGVKVENFTVSFSDGRVLCLLVHHYHPGLLTRADISNDTTQTMGPGAHNVSIDSEADDSFNENWYTSFSPTTGKPDYWDSLLSNERDNFRLLYERVNELGNIPVMVRHGDMSNTIPDEKVVITYVSYLCARLLDIRHETRAARIIQVWWRRHRLHRQKEILQVRQQAALCIQGVVRSFLLCRRTAREAAAALTLQTAVRGVLARREAARRRLQRDMASKIQAVLTIQGYIRSWLVRRQQQREVQAALTIQTWYRMTTARRHYRLQQAAATSIQRYYRAHRAMRLHHSQYQALRAATVTLQSYTRCWLVQRALTQQHGAATRVQTWYRMVRCERHFLMQREAACIIQRQYRACVHGRRQRDRYRQLKAAVTVIERAVVKRKLRLLHKQHVAAVTIQTHWRRLQAVRRYRELCAAAVCVQAWVRGRVQRQHYSQLRQAAVCIQSHTRAWSVRRQHRQRNHSAVTVQAWWRMVRVRRTFLLQQHSATVIQPAYRAVRVSRQERTRYLTLKSAAVTLQRAFMARRARIAVKQHTAARYIQTTWRAHTARTQYRELKTAAVRVQSWYRGVTQRREYLVKQRAATCIQAVVRSWQVRTALRRQTQAATTVQSWWRMVKVQRIYVIQQAAAITIQEHLRAYITGRRQRGRFLRQRVAAVTIQTHYRCHLVAARYRGVRTAVVRIQRWYRAWCDRMRYCRQREAVMCIQRYTRGWSVRRTLRQQTRAARSIQTWWCMQTHRWTYINLRRAALTIQTRLRATLTARRQRERYAALRAAAVTLQRAFVARRARIVLKHNFAATTIQKHWRSHRAVQGYTRTKSAVVVIQRWVRATQQRCRYLELRQAAICVQAHVRGWLVRCRLHKQTTAAVAAQAWWRMVSVRTHYRQQREAATTIQAHYRAHRLGRLQQAQYEKVNTAVSTIQNHYRSYRVRAHYQRQKAAVLVLQTWYRARRQRDTYLSLKQASVCLQSYVRAWLVGRRQRTHYMTVRHTVTKLQAGVRGKQQRARYVAQRQAVVILQASWRGYRQRAEFSRLRKAACVIQTYYRARLLTRQVTTQYVTMRQSAVTLQAAWRGRTQRSRYLRMRNSAVLLQSAWRCYQQKKEFQSKKSAAVYIQRWYRGERLRQHDQREFYITLGAVITLQAAARGWQVRRWVRVVRRLQNAAVTIQSHVRRHQARARYLRVQRAAVTIQRGYRGWVLGSRQYCNYHITRGASLIIQAQVRGWLQRRKYLTIRGATVTLQAHCRGWRARQRYLATKRATITIQSAIRQYLARRELRQRQEERRVQVRTAAATLIQAHYRRHRQQRQLLRLRAAVVVTQHYYRARLSMRYHRYHYLLKKRAAVTIQTALRGHLARKELKRRQEEHIHEIKTTAATCIQAHFRRHRQQRQILRLRAAVVVTQHYYRAKLAMRRQRSKFLQTKRATITIQTAFRGFQARQELTRRKAAKELEIRHSAATCIQAFYRSYREQRRLLKLKAAVVITQHYYRARLSMKHHRHQYVQKKRATVVIQTAIRSFLARKELQKRQEERVVVIKNTAATCIQAYFRRYKQQRQILRLKAAVVVTQHYYRAKFAMRRQRSQFLETKRATITIQTAFRGFQARHELTRRKAAKELEIRHSAATFIQAYYRSYREQRQLLRLKAAVVITQHYYRARLSMKYQRYQYVQKRKATVIIQTAIRGYLARKELKRRQEERVVVIKTTAATCIQAYFRRYRQQRQILRLRAAVVVTQHYYRAKLAMRRQRSKFLQTKRATITIQTAFRQYLARRELRQRQEERRVERRIVAATCIQAHYRRHRQQRRLLRLTAAVVVTQHYYRARLAMRQHREAFLLTRRAAVSIQAGVRGCLVRRHVRRQHAASTRIQATYRGYVARCEFVTLRAAARTIQAVYRAHVLRRQAVRQYRVIRQSAVTIQAVYRGYIKRRELAVRTTSATLIQAVYRGYRARTRYTRLRAAAVVLQVQYRSVGVMRVQRGWFVTQRGAATTLQAAVRGHVVRRRLREQHAAVTLLQAAYRRHRCQTVYRALRTEQRRRTHAVTLIQRCYRCYHTRKVTRVAAERRVVYLQKVTSVTRRYISAVRIQRAFRKHRALKEAKRQIKSILILQRWMRGRLDRMRYLRLRQKVIVIQRRARTYLSRRETSVVKIQTYVRNWLARRRMQRVLRGVRRIQALWRGYRVRRDGKSSKVRAARRRVEAANANVTAEKKLGHMTCGALDFLLRCKQLSTIMEALMMLEPATRWSSVCCEQMAASNAAGVLFALIRSCNRSVPHMDIITFSIDILLNLTKYEKTSSTVYEAEGSIPTLMRLLTIYREKGVIFNKACTLLGLLSYPEHRRLEVLAVPQLIDQVRGIHALTLRKYKMEEERNLVKTKMAAASSLFGNSFLGLAPTRPTLPRIEPEWLLRRQSVRQMETPLQATRFVMTALQIAPKK